MVASAILSVGMGGATGARNPQKFYKLMKRIS